jgi:hypothetical protein
VRFERAPLLAIGVYRREREEFFVLFVSLQNVAGSNAPLR